MKIKFAIIGMGVISKYFVNAILRAFDAELVAVCRRSKKPLPPEIPQSVKVYHDYLQMLKEVDIDIVIIATPNFEHFQMAEACLKARKHVLCEKPLTLTAGDAATLISLAKEQNVLLRTISHRRYNKNITDLSKSANKNEIAVIYARYLENIPDHSGNNEWYKDLHQSGGGCVIDNGINVFDVLRQLVGDLEVESAHVGYRNERNIRYDQDAFITLRFSGGIAFVALDWHYHGEEKDVTLYLKNGEVIYRDMLAGTEGFKSSLWHEYELAITEAINMIKSGTFPEDNDSFQAISLVEDVYRHPSYRTLINHA